MSQNKKASLKKQLLNRLANRVPRLDVKYYRVREQRQMERGAVICWKIKGAFTAPL